MSGTWNPKGVKTKFWLVFFLVAPVLPAFSYIDPGSGALIWQMLLAGVVGCLFYIKQIYLWFVSLFSQEKPKDKDET